MDFVIIYNSSNEIDATLIQGFLESRDIVTKIVTTNARSGKYIGANVPYAITVKNKDKDKAIQFLKDRDINLN
ncbi:hypothetical protein H0W91_04030 [Patescibacteria group bacterium]|nr:hypothetical protein [Patescibacteria group bacterium]